MWRQWRGRREEEKTRRKVCRMYGAERGEKVEGERHGASGGGRREEEKTRGKGVQTEQLSPARVGIILVETICSIAISESVVVVNNTRFKKLFFINIYHINNSNIIGHINLVPLVI